MPTLFSGSFSMGSDIYGIDTPSEDLRSFSGELLSSFDQLDSALPECEIIALIKTANKVVIPFRMGNYDQFSIKIWDMFFDRKVFYNRAIDARDNYLNTSFYILPDGKIAIMRDPSDTLSFTREQASIATQRNKDILNRNGINVDLNYVIIGDDVDNKNKAKRLLEIGAFDYDFNNNIQQDTMFVHKIYGMSIIATPVIASSGRR